MSQPSLLRVTDLWKSYPDEAGDVPVLKNVSLSIAPGETVAMTGESGSGKSTLLQLVGGLDQPDGGTVVMNDTDFGSLNDSGRAAIRRHCIGVVFQQFNLIPSLNTADNIAFQARLAEAFDADWHARLTERLGLTDHLTKYPEQLSGGQQQRVAIGRALSHRPGLILADEPTGNLDEATGDAVLALMLDLVAETDAALLMVTHSTRLAARLDRRLHLSAGKIT